MNNSPLQYQINYCMPCCLFVSISQCLLCGVLLPELLVVVLANFLDHVQCLSDQLLLDDLQEFVLLQGLTGNIQR